MKKKLIYCISLFLLYVFVYFNSVMAAEREDTSLGTPLSSYFRYRDVIGDFSYRNIVERKIHHDQQSIDSIITTLGQLSSEHSDRLYKLDFSSSHIVSSCFEKIIDFLLLEKNRGLSANLRFLNFSSNLNIVISSAHLEKLNSLFDYFPNIYLDLTNTSSSNMELIRELSNLKIIWIPENWLKWGRESEQYYIAIRKQYQGLVGEIDSSFLLSHQTYFQNKKLGEAYWVGTSFEAFNKNTRISEVGDIDRIIQEIRGDLVSVSSSFERHIEELRFSNVNAFLTVGKAYLEQKRLKNNPIKSFLLIKYIVDQCNNLENYTEQIADAYWVLSTFYRDGYVVKYNHEIESSLSSNEIKKQSPQALEDLEADHPELIPDDVTDASLSIASHYADLLHIDLLERDYDIFSPAEEDVWGDVYESKISENLITHITKAKKGESAHSAFIVGRYYISGRNLKRDLVKSYKWLRYSISLWEQKNARKNKAEPDYLSDARKRVAKIESIAKK